MSRGPAWGPLGWAGTLSPRMGRVGFAGLWGTSLRCCVGSRLGETIEHMCLYCQGCGVTPGGRGITPRPHRGTLTPLVPLFRHRRICDALGPSRERGREKQRQTLALVQYLGEGEGVEVDSLPPTSWGQAGDGVVGSVGESDGLTSKRSLVRVQYRPRGG